jgi:hypothetical protein
VLLIKVFKGLRVMSFRILAEFMITDLRRNTCGVIKMKIETRYISKVNILAQIPQVS